MTTSSPATIETSALSVATVTGPGAAVAMLNLLPPARRPFRPYQLLSSAGEPRLASFLRSVQEPQTRVLDIDLL